MKRRRRSPSVLLRAVLRHLLDGLTQYGLCMSGAGDIWIQGRMRESDNAAGEGPAPGHPERVEPAHVPSAEERLLWKQFS